MGTNRMLGYPQRAFGWLFLILLSPHAHAMCPQNTFWSPKKQFSDGVTIAYSEWECRACPANSVQFKDEFGVSKDESCMCKTGFRATNAKNQYSNYLGNPDGLWPPVYDSFECTACNDMEYCPGGAVEWRTDKEQTDLFYIQCNECPSRYRRVPLYQMGIAKKNDQHFPPKSPPLTCKIFGQRVPSGGQSIDPANYFCSCPANTYVVLKTRPNPVTKNIDSGVPDGYISQVWNYDILPDFKDPDTKSSNMYFGYCECNAGKLNLLSLIMLELSQSTSDDACTQCRIL